MDDETSKAHLKLVLERVVYVLHRLAADHALLLDGRYHQSAVDALEAFEQRLKESGGWHGLLQDPGHKWHKGHNEQLNRNLMEHGLTGPEGALKYQAFDHHFQQLLDRMARLEETSRGLNTRLTELEVKDFKVRVRGARNSGRATLECAQPILESAAAAIPGGGAIIASLNEMSGVFGGLVRWKQS